MKIFVLLLIAILVVGARAGDEGMVFVNVFRNGGNNTALQRDPIRLAVKPGQSLESFVLRAAAKLNYLPHDCTPFSLRRPKRPLSYFARPNSPDREPDQRCGGYPSYVHGLRLFDVLGRQLWSLGHLVNEEQLFLVPPGDHFFWPGQYVGRWLALPDCRIPREGREAEDEAHNEAVMAANPNYNVSELVGEPVRILTVSLVPRIFYIPRLLTNHETDLVRAHASGLRRSTGFGAGGRADVTAERTSRNTWLNCVEGGKLAFACVIERRVARLLRMPYRHVEKHSDTLQVLHYDAGQKYNAHTDWFDPTQAPQTPGLKEGYNRMLTVFMYLTDTSRGGGTVFPHAGDPDLNPHINEALGGQFRGVTRDGSAPADTLESKGTLYNPYALDESVDFTDCSRGIMAQPTRASSVMWYNMLVYGNGHEAFTDPRSLHGGCPPSTDADKWAVNKWVYNHNWAHKDLQDTWEQPLPPIGQRPEQTPLKEWIDDVDCEWSQFSSTYRTELAEQLRIEKNLPPPPPPLDPDDAPTGVHDQGSLSITVASECDQEVRFMWVDPAAGVEHTQSLFKPNEEPKVVKTFEGHQFVVRPLDQDEGEPLARFTASSDVESWKIQC